jgi:hypothetical protein
VFGDGGLTMVITIMVLELQVPHGGDSCTLYPLTIRRESAAPLSEASLRLPITPSSRRPAQVKPCYAILDVISRR